MLLAPPLDVLVLRLFLGKTSISFGLTAVQIWKGSELHTMLTDKFARARRRNMNKS